MTGLVKEEHDGHHRGQLACLAVLRSLGPLLVTGGMLLLALLVTGGMLMHRHTHTHTHSC